MSYMVFGLFASNLDAARAAVEATLGIEMIPHESMYFGGDYFRSADDEGEHFILQQNYDAFDEGPIEPSFPQHGLLLYANETPRADEIMRAMQGVGQVLSSRDG